MPQDRRGPGQGDRRAQGAMQVGGITGEYSALSVLLEPLLEPYSCRDSRGFLRPL